MKEQKEQFDWKEVRNTLNKIGEQGKWQQRNLAEFRHLYDARTISRSPALIVKPLTIATDHSPSRRNPLTITKKPTHHHSQLTVTPVRSHLCASHLRQPCRTQPSPSPFSPSLMTVVVAALTIALLLHSTLIVFSVP
ncbi:hypothetical protein Ahy_A09g044236 isoform B [Arachis hypogaea]|uniref:Uncharacterized protein n=1 Tax=Arachis hypogaea TaxID=3818 RepID=A0A445BJR5_ARAHY|nr:hypothetical protein Ahy_A09g044236 isoform B [Arachis hypogaea]